MRLSKIYNIIFLSSFLAACSSSNTINSSWMADNQDQIGNKKLSGIVIPGSHFSNAYGIKQSSQLTICSGETLPNSVSNSAKIAQLLTNSKSISQEDYVEHLNTQGNDITGQLNNGVRYLEIQVCLQKANYYTSNYYLTETLDSVTKQIKNFIDDNPKEIIIIDLDNNIRSDYGYLTSNDINILHNYFQMQFGSYLMPHQDWQKLTLNDIWSTKHRIILLSSNPALVKYYDIWNKNEIVIQPEDPEYTTIKKLTMIQKFVQSESNVGESNLTVIPIYSHFDPERNTVSQLSDNPNDHLILDYLRSLPKEAPLNIIVTDKEYNRQLVNFAIQKNTQ